MSFESFGPSLPARRPQRSADHEPAPAPVPELTTLPDSNVLVELSSEPLDLTKLVDFVRSEEAGAISTFSGTTRNNFTVNGVKKRVLLLSYEAYEPMALSELRLIIKEAHVRYPTILKVGIAHRTGDVPVAEASVVIATSSPQRKDAMHATEWILDELKRRVPIWKKEVYDDGSVWKQNGECDWAKAKA